MLEEMGNEASEHLIRFLWGADAERNQDGAAEGPPPAANGGPDTPTTARSRVVRQGIPSSSNLAAPSPSFAAADSASLRSYNLK